MTTLAVAFVNSLILLILPHARLRTSSTLAWMTVIRSERPLAATSLRAMTAMSLASTAYTLDKVDGTQLGRGVVRTHAGKGGGEEGPGRREAGKAGGGHR